MLMLKGLPVPPALPSPLLLLSFLLSILAPSFSTQVSLVFYKGSLLGFKALPQTMLESVFVSCRLLALWLRKRPLLLVSKKGVPLVPVSAMRMETV